MQLRAATNSFNILKKELQVSGSSWIVLTEVVPPPENFPLFAYTALPFSMLPDRIDQNILLSDVVGLVNKVTDVLPLSGNARS